MVQKIDINASILKQCREQIALPLESVKKTVAYISEIERNKRQPTLKQLSKLADLYEVPRWVFIAKELPKEYQYHNNPAFRRMRNTENELPEKIYKLIARVEQYRNLFLELRADLNNPIAKFDPPPISSDASQMATTVRKWLSLTEPLDFESLKQRLVDKNIFIFCSNKYTHWSKISSSIRGLSIFYDTLPLIIVNDSDYRKAQSFTLLHELAHVLRKQTAIDGWIENFQEASSEETWCDRLAGSVLMPSDRFAGLNFDNLEAITKLAKDLKVSTHACLVRAHHIDKLNKEQFLRFQSILKAKHDQLQKKLEDAKGGAARNRIKETKNQFDSSFIKAVIDSYYQKELNLYQSIRLLDLKRASHFLKLAGDI